jgi:hypothetical protein
MRRVLAWIPLLIVLFAVSYCVVRSCRADKPKPNVTCTDGLCVSKDDFPITVHYERRSDLPPMLAKCGSNTILVEKGRKVLCPRLFE